MQLIQCWNFATFETKKRFLWLQFQLLKSLVPDQILHSLVCMYSASGREEGKLEHFPALFCHWYRTRSEREQTSFPAMRQIVAIIPKWNLIIAQSEGINSGLPTSVGGDILVSYGCDKMSVGHRMSNTFFSSFVTEIKVVPPPAWRAWHPSHLSGASSNRYVCNVTFVAIFYVVVIKKYSVVCYCHARHSPTDFHMFFISSFPFLFKQIKDSQWYLNGILKSLFQSNVYSLNN